MKNILFVTSGLGAGGAEKIIALLAQHWSDAGHKIAIASFDHAGDNTYHSFAASVALHRLGDEASSLRRGKFSKVADLVALRSLIRRERPDIVVSFLTKNNLLALVATIGTDTKVVCCERNNPERQGAHAFWNLALSVAYRRASLIICQTAAVTRCIPHAVHDRIKVIPNPIKKWSFAHEEQSPPTLVAVGRLTHQKGFDMLIDAFASIAGKSKGWLLEIWGDGPDRSQLEAQIRGAGLEDRIALKGLSEEPGSWLKNAHIFVLPSRYEGFPNVLGEAMAAGLPVVSFDCDFGPSDMIRHNHNGMLVDPEDKTALAKAMSRCMAYAPLRKRLGQTAMESITQFSPANTLCAWDDALDEAMATPEKRQSNLVMRSVSAAK